MRAGVLVHVIAGALGLLFGFVALFARKGASVHRKSGVLFVFAMLTMSLTGATVAAIGKNEGSVIAGLLAAYLVTTALLTVRPLTPTRRRVEVGAMLVALAMGASSLALGVDAFRTPGGARGGIPFPVFFMFGSIALLSGIGDVRMIRSAPLQRVPRLTRHLWRMCYALWIATASFFLGPRERVEKVLPDALVIPAVLAIPVLTVLVIMFYWLWRVRVRRSLRGIKEAREESAVLA